MRDFYDMCGLPIVVKAINNTHLIIRKPTMASKDYFYFDIGGYSMHFQTMVAKNKWIINMYVSMLRGINDSCAMKRTSLY